MRISFVNFNHDKFYSKLYVNKNYEVLKTGYFSDLILVYFNVINLHVEKCWFNFWMRRNSSCSFLEPWVVSNVQRFHFYLMKQPWICCLPRGLVVMVCCHLVALARWSASYLRTIGIYWVAPMESVFHLLHRHEAPLLYYSLILFILLCSFSQFSRLPFGLFSNGYHGFSYTDWASLSCLNMEI